LTETLREAWAALTAQVNPSLTPYNMFAQVNCNIIKCGGAMSTKTAAISQETELSGFLPCLRLSVFRTQAGRQAKAATEAAFCGGKTR
jgi:hypothetical protein